MSDSPGILSAEAMQHYNTINEAQRLSRRAGLLELARTQEISQRYFPSPPAVMLDVGGGAGVYSLWLAKLGYEVHLVDAVPLHIEQAQAAAQSQPDYPLASSMVGDARQLEQADGSVDAVLMLGPLYHLIERTDRLQALSEAYRVLRKGGVIIAAGVSRFASALDGLFRGLIDDPQFVSIVQQDLSDGQHRNPTNNPGYFTTTFFHLPPDLEAEVIEAGFQSEGLRAVEGPGWLLNDFEEAYWHDPVRREQLLDIIRRIEQQPSIMGMSAHFLAIGRK